MKDDIRPKEMKETIFKAADTRCDEETRAILYRISGRRGSEGMKNRKVFSQDPRMKRPHLAVLYAVNEW